MERARSWFAMLSSRESHNDLDILAINIATVFHALADQSQHFQSAENNLMFSRP